MGKPGPRVLRWAEVKERTDIHTYEGTTEWGNHDLYPIDQKDKKFGYFAYASYWATGGFALFTFTLGSGYIAVGLNAGETIGASLIGAIISAIIGYFGARPGQDYGIGYVCFPMLVLYNLLMAVAYPGLDRVKQNGFWHAWNISSHFHRLRWRHGVRK